MREYTRQITIMGQGLPDKATLKIIRLPTSWYAVIWASPERYIAFSQDRTALNGGHEHLDDDDFLDRVRLVSGFTQGVDFEFEPD